VPEAGWSLLTADYSQIELRLLAHFCGDDHQVDRVAVEIGPGAPASPAVAHIEVMPSCTMGCLAI
jgi:hypothetical protein